MGMFLAIAMLAGFLAGLIVAVILGSAGLVLTIKSAKTRVRVWRCFGAVVVVLLVLGIVAVYEYPYDPVRPGSDYDIAMKNLFLQGFGYGAVAGPSMLLAAVGTLLMPRKHKAAPPPLSA